MPATWQPQLATLVAAPPAGDQWLHELKFDGYRMGCRIAEGQARLFSRRNNDWTGKMGAVAQQAVHLPVRAALLDGEVIVMDEHGVSSFQLLQNAIGLQPRPAALIYYVFDVLHLDGFDLTRVALDERKAVVEALVAALPRNVRQIRLSEHFIGDGEAFHRQACQAGLEGIISKRRDMPYIAGRSQSWLKIKCRQSQELVIGGFTRPGGSRTAFGALLVGYYEPDGEFRYAGRVGTGFNEKMLHDLHARLLKLKQSKSPFDPLPSRAGNEAVTWVRPELVGQIEFSNWTHENLLRQAAFQGLREDKPARYVKREMPAATPGAVRRTARKRKQ